MTDITQADIAKLKEALEKARDTFKAFQDDNSHNAMQERLDSAYSDVGAYHAEILAVLSENERLRKERDDMQAKLDAVSTQIAAKVKQEKENLADAKSRHDTDEVAAFSRSSFVLANLLSAIRNLKPEVGNG